MCHNRENITNFCAFSSWIARIIIHSHIWSALKILLNKINVIKVLKLSHINWTMVTEYNVAGSWWPTIPSSTCTAPCCCLYTCRSIVISPMVLILLVPLQKPLVSFCVGSNKILFIFVVNHLRRDYPTEIVLTTRSSRPPRSLRPFWSRHILRISLKLFNFLYNLELDNCLLNYSGASVF